MRTFFQNLHRLYRVASGRPQLIFYFFLSCGAYTLVSLLPPYATSGIIRAVTERDFSACLPYSLLYIVTYATYFLFIRINMSIYTQLSEYYQVASRRRLFRVVSTVPELLKHNPRGRIVDTFSDDTRWIVDAVNAAINGIVYMIQIFVVFFILLNCNWQAGLIAMFIDLGYILILTYNSRRVARAYSDTRRQEDRAISAFNELVSHKLAQIEHAETSVGTKVKPEVKPNHIDKSCESKMNSSFSPWRKAYERKRRAMIDRSSLWAAIPYLGKLLLYIFLAEMVIKGDLRLDMLVMIIGYFEMTINVMDKLATSLLDFANYGVRLSRIECLNSDSPNQCVV